MTAIQERNHQERNHADAIRLTDLSPEAATIARMPMPTLPNMPVADTFPICLPNALSVTAILAPVRNNAHTDMPAIDAVFSKTVPQTRDSAEGAHVIVAGDTLYVHGCDLPALATAVLEAQNNPFASPCELDAYGWSTMKSVKLPETLCEGDYCLHIVSKDGASRSNAVFLTVRPQHAPLYVSRFKGWKCLQTSSALGADHPYLLGVAVDSSGWKTFSYGAGPSLQPGESMRVDVGLGGKYDNAGQALPIMDPGKAVFHIGLGSANNFRQGLFGKRWNMDSYNVTTPDAWGDHKETELWSHIVMDRALLGKTDLTQPDLGWALQEYVQETIVEGGEDTLLGTATLTWSREEVETARQINGEQDVVKFLDLRYGSAHYRLEFRLCRVYNEVPIHQALRRERGM